jgi:cytochrome b561
MTNDNVEYHAIAKILHWFPLVLIAVQFPLGWLMPPTGRDEIPSASVNLHFTIGMVLLIVFTLRFLWRIARPVGMHPALVDWQKKLAHAAHWLLYVLAFATLMTGWIHASERGWPIKMFGLIPVPPICPAGSEIAHYLGEFHKGAGLALLAGILVHFAGVMFHELVQGDKILVRMLPRNASGWLPGLESLWQPPTRGQAGE